jgi:hypothetical protein
VSAAVAAKANNSMRATVRQIGRGAVFIKLTPQLLEEWPALCEGVQSSTIMD